MVEYDQVPDGVSLVKLSAIMEVVLGLLYLFAPFFNSMYKYYNKCRVECQHNFGIKIFYTSLIWPLDTASDW